MTVALISIALLGFLVLGLGLYVVFNRGKTNTIIGTVDAPDNPLNKAIRAHGNATEYSPMLAVLMFVLGSMHPENWVIWCMGLATFSRYIHAAGMIFPETMAKPNLMRFVGALGTFVFGLALCIALVLKLV